MRDSSRIAYAQARVQARFGERPTDAFWRELEAGRELAHLIEIVRPGPLGQAVEGVPPTVEAHALEARLRSHWAASCAEVAGWYPPDWRPAMAWLAWLPWLAGLGWLSQGRTPLAWMRDDRLLGPVASGDGEAQADALAASPLAPLATAFGSHENLAEAWRTHWRGLWPAAGAATRQGLARLDAALGGLLPGEALASGPAFNAQADLTEAVVRRLFRRHAGTPVAGLCLLVLLWLDYLRLRAALAVARSFGMARAA
jgi:hypothetical protein